MPDSDLLPPEDESPKGQYWASVLRFIMNSLGGPLGAAAGAWSEAEQSRINEYFVAILQMEEEKLREMLKTLQEIEERVDTTDKQIKERIQSAEYLSLVKRCFRDWSAAESHEKRAYIRNLLVNAAQSKISDDDTLRLFIRWIDDYSEMHFSVIKAIFESNGITRAGIWEQIKGVPARDNSPEADLFKLLIHDLSVGHIIRQFREANSNGQFYKRQRSRPSQSPVLQTPFDNSKPYELTALGNHFVHYVMTDIVGKIEGK